MRFGYFFAVSVGASASTKNCLLLTDTDISNFSQFESRLRDECDGYLSVKSVSDTSVRLDAFGDYEYSDLAILVNKAKTFAFSKKDDLKNLPENPKLYRQAAEEMVAAHHVTAGRTQGGITVHAVHEFVDSGRNVFIAVQGGEETVSKELAELVKGLGFKIWTKPVVDHFHEGVVLSSPPLVTEPWTKLVAGDSTSGVAFTGSPIGLNIENRNVFSVLRASPTASHPLSESQGLLLTLAGAHQATNGARAILLGSTSMISDEFLDKYGENGKFMNSALSWCLGNSHLVRLTEFAHHKVGESAPPRMYKERDNLVVKFRLEKNFEKKWIPFPVSDLQIEYVMLDPYVRQHMRFDPATGLHTTNITAPDKNGIFKFRIKYHRMGLNPIDLEQVATIRTPKHNDGERFIPAAYPYYGGAFVSLALVAAFSVLFLNHREVKEKAT
jgi:oligosaccharyltransferase complex subunit beta